jgi:hypothetical protein
VSIDPAFWPGTHQVFLPSMRASPVIGTNTPLSFTSPNNLFMPAVGGAGIAHAFRPNSSTEPGESYLWNCGDFNVGPDASMLAVLAATNFGTINSSGIQYGGFNDGLRLYLLSANTVRATYIDNPTTNQFDASITGLSLSNKVYYTVGLTKRGNTVKAFFGNSIASASGGNGGIRRGSSTGLGYYHSDYYGLTLLAAISSVPIDDSTMQRLMFNPWLIFKPRSIFVPVTAAAGSSLPTLSDPTIVPGSLTSTGFRPRVTITF